jgi:hypothetical protein
MTILVTHPDNVGVLRNSFAARREVRSRFSPYTSLFPSIEIRANACLERDKPTGRYRIKGESVARDPVDVKISTRFVDYGPEDIPYLLYAGMIEEEREMIFYEVNLDHLYDLSNDGDLAWLDGWIEAGNAAKEAQPK